MPVHTQNFLEILQNAHRVNFTHVNTITIYHTILAEIIHKPIWKCINNGANNMYQLG